MSCPSTNRVGWGTLRCFGENGCSVSLKENITIIGRGNPEFKINYSAVSNRHCSVTRKFVGNEHLYIIEDHSSNGTYLNKTKIEKGSEVVLHSYDEITLLNPQLPESKNFSYMFVIDQQEEEEMVNGPQKDYEIKSYLGSGTYGVVRCIQPKNSNEIFAVKILSNTLVKTRGADEMVQRECDMLSSIRHENIVNIIKSYKTTYHVFIIMEYMAGGDLLAAISRSHQQAIEKSQSFMNELIEKMQKSYLTHDAEELQSLENTKQELEQRIRYTGFEEELCKKIIQQVLKALAFLHENKIIHRDLKLENVMWTGINDCIKLTDFGLGRVVGDDSKAKTICGTAMYAPPEMHQGKVYDGTKADIYSAGVLLYVMACNDLPFDNQSSGNLTKNIITGNVKPNIRFKQFSPSFSDLLFQMIATEPEKRLTAEECLAHEFFAERHRIDIAPQSKKTQ
ncbi:Protein kinase [Entamoeba marina]